jgi:predicted permease
MILPYSAEDYKVYVDFQTKRHKNRELLLIFMGFQQLAGMWDLSQQPLWVIALFIIMGIWSLIWNGLGLWHSSQHKQKNWFVAILILNTLGLLPIIYLIWFKPKEKIKSKKK